VLAARAAKPATRLTPAAIMTAHRRQTRHETMIDSGAGEQVAWFGSREETAAVRRERPHR
jgi:uncharacterized RmlC-like cupin family protein